MGRGASPPSIARHRQRARVARAAASRSGARRTPRSSPEAEQVHAVRRDRRVPAAGRGDGSRSSSCSTTCSGRTRRRGTCSSTSCRSSSMERVLHLPHDALGRHARRGARAPQSVAARRALPRDRAVAPQRRRRSPVAGGRIRRRGEPRAVVVPTALLRGQPAARDAARAHAARRRRRALRARALGHCASERDRDLPSALTGLMDRRLERLSAGHASHPQHRRRDRPRRSTSTSRSRRAPAPRTKCSTRSTRGSSTPSSRRPTRAAVNSRSRTGCSSTPFAASINPRRLARIHERVAAGDGGAHPGQRRRDRDSLRSRRHSAQGVSARVMARSARRSPCTRTPKRGDSSRSPSAPRAIPGERATALLGLARSRRPRAATR